MERTEQLHGDPDVLFTLMHPRLKRWILSQTAMVQNTLSVTHRDVAHNQNVQAIYHRIGPSAGRCIFWKRKWNTVSVEIP